MADLIIKPNSATGDKLILQDRAGGAVLTTADSGATLADGIALGTPASGILPVGVTGGSGLTVGAMTIKQIGTQITGSGLDAQTVNSMDNTGFSVNNLTITASNKLLCIAHVFVTLHGNNQFFNRGYLRLTDGTNHSPTLPVNNFSSITGAAAAYGTGFMVTIYHIFPHTSTTPTITLQTQCRHTGSGRTIEVDMNYSHLQLFEIQV
jgi:hypothetical protein